MSNDARSRSTQWREILSNELRKLRELPPGTDSWSPHQPTGRALESAYMLLKAIRFDNLPIAMVSASPDGVICIEWRMPNQVVSLYLFSDGMVEGYAALPNRAPYEVEIPPNQLDMANELLSPLAT